MVAPIHPHHQTLTGKARARIGRFGRVIMQVEVEVNVHDWSSRSNRIIETYVTWRDAKKSDVLVLRTFDMKGEVKNGS